MDNDSMLTWIDAADYETLLNKWRYSPSGDPFLSGEIGKYYAKVMGEKKDALVPGEAVSISKSVGW